MPGMDIGEEVGTKKTFVWAIDWPGWCRSGKDRDLAIKALLAHRGRYAKVAQRAGVELPSPEPTDFRVVEKVEGNGGTDFGVPSRITEADGRRVTAKEAERLAGLVEAAWVIRSRRGEGAADPAQGAAGRGPGHGQDRRARRRGRSSVRP